MKSGNMTCGYKAIVGDDGGEAARRHGCTQKSINSPVALAPAAAIDEYDYGAVFRGAILRFISRAINIELVTCKGAIALRALNVTRRPQP